MPNQFSQPDFQLLIDDLNTFQGIELQERDIFSVAELKTGDSEHNKAMVTINYRYEYFDIISRVENAAISLAEIAEEKKINLQVYFSPVPVIISADRGFLEPLLYKILFQILDHSIEGSVINIHITDSDGRCIIESIHKNSIINKQTSNDYFKKHRITNPLYSSAETEKDVLPLYKKVVEDMGGELVYAFNKDRDNYFRLKFPLA